MNRMPRFIVPAIVFGAALVAFPFFFLRLALFALIVGGALRFIRRRAFGGGAGYQGKWGNPWQTRRMEFTDRIRTMSDTEYADFVQQNKPQRPIPIESFDRRSEDFVL
jgi:hypothetical protein